MCLEVKMPETIYDWCVYRPKCKKPGINDVFNNENAKSKRWMLYLQVKMQQEMYN